LFGSRKSRTPERHASFFERSKLLHSECSCWERRLYNAPVASRM
jgi:hypothetical protein